MQVDIEKSNAKRINNEVWFFRFAGIGSGLILAATHIFALLAPLQLM